jgi:hypothetical protein
MIAIIMSEYVEDQTIWIAYFVFDEKKKYGVALKV